MYITIRIGPAFTYHPQPVPLLTYQSTHQLSCPWIRFFCLVVHKFQTNFDSQPPVILLVLNGGAPFFFSFGFQFPPESQCHGLGLSFAFYPFASIQTHQPSSYPFCKLHLHRSEAAVSVYIHSRIAAQITGKADTLVTHCRILITVDRKSVV